MPQSLASTCSNRHYPSPKNLSLPPRPVTVWTVQARWPQVITIWAGPKSNRALIALASSSSRRRLTKVDHPWAAYQMQSLLRPHNPKRCRSNTRASSLLINKILQETLCKTIRLWSSPISTQGLMRKITSYREALESRVVAGYNLARYPCAPVTRRIKSSGQTRTSMGLNSTFKRPQWMIKKELPLIKIQDRLRVIGASISHLPQMDWILHI